MRQSNKKINLGYRRDKIVDMICEGVPSAVDFKARCNEDDIVLRPVADNCSSEVSIAKTAFAEWKLEEAIKTAKVSYNLDIVFVTIFKDKTDEVKQRMKGVEVVDDLDEYINGIKHNSSLVI